MMAHVNTAGVHIPIWLTSEAPQIGWGLDLVNYPKQEGTFFGNIIETGDLTQMNMADSPDRLIGGHPTTRSSNRRIYRV